MSQTVFSSDWLSQLSSDPYAVLGISVAADDRRVLKRYRTIAKILHPDSYATEEPSTKELSSQILARLVNPAYQRLKLENGRAEAMATLRFRVRRTSREEPLNPQTDLSRRLLTTPVADIEVFYEQAIAGLSEQQYQRCEQIDQLERTIQQLSELNLVYLRMKMGEPLIREKRLGMVPVTDAPSIPFSPTPVDSPSRTNYALRHYRRAEEYVSKENWQMAVQELRDAIKIEPNKSEYHSLLAKVYFMQNMEGMAKVHFKQALKFNPKDPLALEYARKLKIQLDQPTNGKEAKGGGLFGMFAKKR